MNPNVKTVIKKQKRMLMLGDWHGASTGFGTVTKNILPHILKHYGDGLHIFFVAINYFGEPYVEGNMTVVSAKNYYTPLLEDGTTSAEPNPHGKHAFCMQLLGDKLGFDLVFLIHDIGLLDKNNIFQFLNEAHAYKQQNNLRNFKSVLYTPVDSRLTKEHIRNLHCIDTIITYNKFSRHEIVRNRPELLKRVKTIPHGINPDDFFVMEPAEVKKFREQYFGVENAGKIIFCNINRNQPRKAIGETILAFIEAKEQWPDAHLPPPFLYLHMLEKDPLMSGYDLREIFAQTDLVEGKDYKIAPQEFFTQANGADIATLRAIYNASDIYITTTTGEGWGLSVVEAFACRTPVILPLHTSFTEISSNGERAHTMHNMVPFINQFDQTIRMQTDIFECAEVMIQAAHELRSGESKKMINAAQQYARSLSWKAISDRFVEYFDELM